MKEIEMTLEEIRTNFGDEIAEECDKMEDNETREFHTATYEGIVVRCVRGFWTTYYVRGECIMEEALEMGMDYGLGM